MTLSEALVFSAKKSLSLKMSFVGSVGLYKCEVVLPPDRNFPSQAIASSCRDTVEFAIVAAVEKAVEVFNEAQQEQEEYS